MGKYVVFKKEDFDSWMSQLDSIPHDMEPLADATVIRKQDTFAAVPFYAYAASVLAAMNVLRKQQGGYSHREMDRLENLMLYFSEQAQGASALAALGHAKVPD